MTTRAISVMDAAGRPVCDATAIVSPHLVYEKATTYQPAYTFDGSTRPQRTDGLPSWQTGDDGTCTIRCATPDGAVVVIDPSGWAVVDQNTLRDEPQIRLQPWARITGQLKRNGKPVAGWIIIARRDHADFKTDSVASRQVTSTDVNGRFMFDHLPPGRLVVGAMATQDGSRADANNVAALVASQTLKLKPDESRDVVLGNIGSPVEGDVALPPGIDRSSVTVSGTFTFEPPFIPLPWPPEIANGTYEQRMSWFHDYENSPAYADRMDAISMSADLQASLPLRWTGTTHFSIEDAPPGNYLLELRVMPIGASVGKAMLVSALQRVSVPALQSGWSDTPVSVPAVALHAPADSIKVGEPALDCTLQTLDGQPVKLSSFRGKFLLMHCWSAVNTTSLLDVPILREIHDAHANDPRFAMMGVTYDISLERTKAYVAAQGMDWLETYPGNPVDPTFSEPYGRRKMPHAFLIGPDGTVLAIDLHGREMEKTIESLLPASGAAPATTVPSAMPSP